MNSTTSYIELQNKGQNFKEDLQLRQKMEMNYQKLKPKNTKQKINT